MRIEQIRFVSSGIQRTALIHRSRGPTRITMVMLHGAPKYPVVGNSGSFLSRFVGIADRGVDLIFPQAHSGLEGRWAIDPVRPDGTQEPDTMLDVVAIKDAIVAAGFEADPTGAPIDDPKEPRDLIVGGLGTGAALTEKFAFLLHRGDTALRHHAMKAIALHSGAASATTLRECAVGSSLSVPMFLRYGNQDQELTEDFKEAMLARLRQSRHADIREVEGKKHTWFMSSTAELRMFLRRNGIGIR